MKGRYVVREGEELLIFDHFEDIPLEFDNLIEFLPEFPPGPHTKEQHEVIDTLGDKLDELLKRERR